MEPIGKNVGQKCDTELVFGEEFVIDKYVSTSYDSNSVFRYASENGIDIYKILILIIDISTGVCSILSKSLFKQENEILLPAGLKIKDSFCQLLNTEFNEGQKTINSFATLTKKLSTEPTNEILKCYYERTLKKPSLTLCRNISMTGVNGKQTTQFRSRYINAFEKDIIINSTCGHALQSMIYDVDNLDATIKITVGSCTVFEGIVSELYNIQTALKETITVNKLDLMYFLDPSSMFLICKYPVRIISSSTINAQIKTIFFSSDEYNRSLMSSDQVIIRRFHKIAIDKNITNICENINQNIFMTGLSVVLKKNAEMTLEEIYEDKKIWSTDLFNLNNIYYYNTYNPNKYTDTMLDKMLPENEYLLKIEDKNPEGTIYVSYYSNFFEKNGKTIFADEFLDSYKKKKSVFEKYVKSKDITLIFKLNTYPLTVSGDKKYECYWFSSDYLNADYPIPLYGDTMDTEFIEKLNQVLQKSTSTMYMGESLCRLCNIRNGNSEYSIGEFTLPSGALHYYKDHNVSPSAEFREYIMNYLI